MDSEILSEVARAIIFEDLSLSAEKQTRSHSHDIFASLFSDSPAPQATLQPSLRRPHQKAKIRRMIELKNKAHAQKMGRGL